MTTAKERRDAKRAQAAAEAASAGKPTSEQIQQINAETMAHPDKVPDAHGEIARPSPGGAKVFVGCKVGVAYIDIQLSKMVEKEEQTQTGLRTVKESERIGPVVRLRGTAYPRGQAPDGFPDRPDVAHGCSINAGIDRDFMLEWMRLNQKNPIVTNQMIFIEDSRERVVARAAELAGVISGFDPMNPRKDPRMPKPTNPGVGDLRTEDERAKKMPSLA